MSMLADRPQPRLVPTGGAGLGVEDYLRFLAGDYLADFIRAGGAAVKFAVPGDARVATSLHAGVARVSAEEGCLYARVDAATTRMHLMDQLFFTVSRQLDWPRLAADVVRTAYDDVAFPASGPDLSVSTVAAAHHVDVRELYRSVRRSLERAVLGDETLGHDFRLAMHRLCQDQLAMGDVLDAERDAVLGWLRGTKVPLPQLRSSLIYARIARHNARAMLTSTARWIARTSAGALVVDIDLERLTESRRPPAAERHGVYYSKAATVDTYEVLRQLVDDTDELTAMLVVVVLPPALVADEGRGLPAYSALQLRIADEVRDRRRANPFAALVRLDARLEVVA